MRPQEGIIAVTVTDSSGNPVAAEVLVEGTTTSRTTDSGGLALLNLIQGETILRVVSPGFASSRHQLVVEAGTDMTLLVSLAPTRVSLADGQIMIRDKIYFETGSADVAQQSHALLDEVALVMLDHPEIALIEVQGHTDDIGQADDNLSLSTARAQAVVRYLVSVGIAAERLRATGKGEEAPLTPETTDEARAKNRRVEFHVRSQGE